MTLDAELQNLEGLEREKRVVDAEIEEIQTAIFELSETVKRVSETLGTRSKEVDESKKEAIKANRALDKALKDVASWVSLAIGHLLKTPDNVLRRTMKSNDSPPNDILSIVAANWRRSIYRSKVDLSKPCRSMRPLRHTRAWTSMARRTRRRTL
jgi:hypothetical protein